jgi:hypothetical protein
MSKRKLRIATTDVDHLVSNLRGEVGEVITSWLLLRRLMTESSRLSSDDPVKDGENRELATLNLMKERFRDDLVARLSELAEEKIG